MALVNGVKMNLGGKDYVVPALLLRDERNNPDIFAKTDPTTDEGFANCVEVVLFAMKRNYPTMTSDDVSGFLDLQNFVPLFKAMRGDIADATDTEGNVPQVAV